MDAYRFRSIACALALLVTTVAVTACGGGNSSASPAPTAPQPPAPVPSRSFQLAFTPWPYAATIDAVNYVYAEVASRGDFIAHHLDSGIPWESALAGAPYPPAVEGEIATRVANTPIGQRGYLGISPLAISRSGLAGNWGAGTNEPLPAPWDSRSFDSPAVITAYVNFAADIIARLEPAYFNFGIEVSELIVNDLAAYDRFVTFAEAVSAELRQRHPDVRLMISVALKSPGSAAMGLVRQHLPRLLPFVDVVGVSVYPFVFFDHPDKGDPANLPPDWLSQITTMAGDKPVAVAETGWPAEPLNIPVFAVAEDSSEANQAAYLERLFADSQTLDAEFIVWFMLVDYDTLWTNTLGQDPLARIWRDTGLFDETLNPRPALDIWQQQRQRPLP